MSPLEGGRISGRHLTALIVLSRLQTSTIILPEITATDAGRDAWTAVLIGTAAAIPFGLLVAKLGTMHRNETLIEYSRRLMGGFLGNILGLAYIGFILLIAASVARELAESYAFAIMPETPLLTFIIGSIWLAGTSARNGIEVIGRMSETALILAILALLATLILPISEMRFDNLLPFLESGPRPLLGASLLTFGLFGEVIAAGMVIPYLDSPQSAARYITAGIVVGGILSLLNVMAITAAFSTMAETILIPTFSLARLISIGEVLDRLEILPFMTWTLIVWLKLAFFLWIVILGLSQISGGSDYRPQAYPAGFLMAALATLLYDNIFEIQESFAPEVMGVFFSVTAVGIIGLLLAASLLRQRSGRE